MTAFGRAPEQRMDAMLRSSPFAAEPVARSPPAGAVAPKCQDEGAQQEIWF
jgi:hypothetical protein